MRVPDWDVRLANWASYWLDAPFSWGHCDCNILALEALQCLTGKPHADAFRGRYDSAAGALRLQRDDDYDLARYLTAQGAQIIPRNFQQRGDILVVMRDGFACGHVCFGERALCAAPDHPVCWGSTEALLDLGAVIYRIG